MVTHPCTPWERAGRPTYSSQISERGFALTTSIGNSPSGCRPAFERTSGNAAHRSLTPFLITLAGFVLAFGITLGIRQHAAPETTATAAAPPAAARMPDAPASEVGKQGKQDETAKPAEGASSTAEAVLFPPPPAIPGVATATLLGPASDVPDQAAKAPTGRHRRYGKKSRRAAAAPAP